MTSIPTEINEVYEELKKEVSWIHAQWIVYRQLFAVSEKRFDLLNECAPEFFYIIQNALLEKVLIFFGNLTDSAKKKEHNNLSLAQLQTRIRAHREEDLAEQTGPILGKINSKCEPFKKWRHKRLAHFDLNTAIKNTSNPLPGISREVIEEALELIREFMNKIEVYYTGEEMGYEHFIMQGDGEALVAMLKSGLRYEELLKDMKISYDDLHHGEWHDA